MDAEYESRPEYTDHHGGAGDDTGPNVSGLMEIRNAANAFEAASERAFASVRPRLGEARSMLTRAKNTGAQ